LEALIAHYGLLAIFLGSGIEGEPFALAGGVLAHRQWLSLHGAMLAAIGGSFGVDQMWFHLSRNLRGNAWVCKVAARPAFGRCLAMIERHPARFVLLFRFAYGLRAITAVAVGTSAMPTRLFVLLNIVAAVVWGTLFTALGYAAGPVLEAMQARYGSGLTLVSVGVSVLVLAMLLRRQRG
jgi:membrane protein DedA with SNARE-associated domain